MGPKNSQPVKEEDTPKINHPKFTSAKFIKLNDDENAIQIKLSIANEKQYDQWVEKIKRIPDDKQPFLVPNKHSFKKQGMCGSSGFTTIQYEAFPFLLADQINNRESLKQKFFDEPELWYLVYTLITAGHQFHENGQKVGDVRPDSVFINEQGQVKVATQYTWPSQSTNYHKTFYEKQPTYLAPQELKDILFAKAQPTCDRKLAQSFSVGLTCLDAGTLGNSSALYLKNNKFDYQMLEKKLDDLQSVKYSQLLTVVIRNLCQVDPERRSTCSQLYRWLKPYEQYIINLENFEVSNLPQKINVGPSIGSPEKIVYQNNPSIVQNQLPPQNVPIQNSPPQNWQQGQPVFTQIQYKPVQGYQQTTNIQSYPHDQGVIRMQSQPYPPTHHQQSPSQDIKRTYIVEQQIKQNINGPITSQTFTSSNYTPVNGQQLIDQNRNIQYTATTQNYTNSYSQKPIEGSSPQKDENRSNMQLTLQKIDEQLQMSRKMFPS